MSRREQLRETPGQSRPWAGRTAANVSSAPLPATGATLGRLWVQPEFAPLPAFFPVRALLGPLSCGPLLGALT